VNFAGFSRITSGFVSVVLVKVVLMIGLVIVAAFEVTENINVKNANKKCCNCFIRLLLMLIS